MRIAIKRSPHQRRSPVHVSEPFAGTETIIAIDHFFFEVNCRINYRLHIVGRNGHDAIFVGNHNVAGTDGYPPATHRLIETPTYVTESGRECGYTATPDREFHFKDFLRIRAQAIDRRTCKARIHGRACHPSAPACMTAIAVTIDNQKIPGTNQTNYVMQQG